jgi:hypothetical protein
MFRIHFGTLRVFYYNKYIFFLAMLTISQKFKRLNLVSFVVNTKNS